MKSGRKAIGALLVLMVMLTVANGCKSDHQAADNWANEAVPSSIEHVPVVSESTEIDFMEELARQHPVLEHLRPMNEPHWDQVMLSNEGHQVVLKDEALIRDMIPLFLLRQNDADWPNGVHSDIDPFFVTLTNTQATIQIEVQSRAYGMLPELTYDIYRLDRDLANVGRAFLPRPSYLPSESLESRLINSGAMRVKNGDAHYYTFSEYRIRGLAKAFLAGRKEAVSDRSEFPPNESEAYTFYLHGEEIVMRLYGNDGIRIDDGEDRFWYKASPELMEQLRSILSAG